MEPLNSRIFKRLTDMCNEELKFAHDPPPDPKMDWL